MSVHCSYHVLGKKENEVGPLGMPCLERRLIGMTLTLKPGELVLKPWTIIGQPTGRLDVGVHGTICHSTVWCSRMTLQLVYLHICTSTKKTTSSN